MGGFLGGFLGDFLADFLGVLGFWGSLRKIFRGLSYL